jgi:hypothetical protein
MNVITLDYIFEELKEKRVKWDKSMLDCLVPEHVNDLSQKTSAEELIYHLNKGNIKVEVEKCYSFLEDNHFRYFLDEEQENKLNFFLKTTFQDRRQYSDGIYDYCAWKWLESKGEMKYQPKRSKISFFAPH